MDNNLAEAEKLIAKFAKENIGFSEVALWQDPTIIQVLVDVKNFDKAIRIMKDKYSTNPQDIQPLVSLSAIYLKSGDKWAAIDQLKKIKAIKPEYTATVDKYIKDIEDGKDPTNTK